MSAIKKRIKRKPLHTHKREAKKLIKENKNDSEYLPVIHYYGEINFVVRVGFCQMIYFYGVEFNRFLN